MKKSRSITLTLMAGLAAACSQQPQVDSLSTSSDALPAATRRCVDDQDRIVADSLCTTPLRHGGGGGGAHPYFFYYGGQSGSPAGAAVMTGGQRAALDAPPPARTTVTRGGLGTTAAGRIGAIGA